MFSFKDVLAALFVLGLVDSIDGDIASVELSDRDGGISYSTMHTSLFPCSVREGDLFYFAHVDGVTEVRCGEPPPH